MAKIYFHYIVAGARNYNNVPVRYKVQVKELLESNGYSINEDGTVTKIQK